MIYQKCKQIFSYQWQKEAPPVDTLQTIAGFPDNPNACDRNEKRLFCGFI